MREHHRRGRLHILPYCDPGLAMSSDGRFIHVKLTVVLVWVAWPVRPVLLVQGARILSREYSTVVLLACWLWPSKALALVSRARVVMWAGVLTGIAHDGQEYRFALWEV